MKNLNKLFTLAALPVMAFVTSCNSAKTISYEDASKFVVEHYDDHSLDYIKGNYTAKLNNFSVDLKAKITDAIGIESDYSIGFGFDGLTVSYNDLPTVIMDSTVLKYVEVAYNTVSKFSFEQLTRFSFDKTYTISNNCLTVKIGTDDNALDVIILASNALNGLALAGQLDMVARYIPVPALVNAIYYIYGGTDPYTRETYGGYLVSCSPTSSTEKGNFYITLKTDDYGIITNANLTFATDVNLDFDAISKDAPSMVYSVGVTGTINFNIDLNVTF